MTITVLSNVIAPNSLWSATVRGKLSRKNKRGVNVGGYVQVNVRRSRTLRSYTFGTVPLSLTVWRELEALFEVTDAGAYGFLLQDPTDCVVSRAYGRMIYHESSDFQYQLVERKGVSGGAVTHDRFITRPNASTFNLWVNGSGVSYTLDDETGIVTIPSGPSLDDIEWAGRTYVPVHFESDDIDWDLVVAGANAEGRLFAGPSVTLMEIRE